MLSAKRTAYTYRQKLASQRVHDMNSQRQKLHHILEYGILAPSTHNTQPWKIALKDRTVELYADLDKKIPQADPTGRDLYMSNGALIKNIQLAAEQLGAIQSTKLSAKIEPDKPVATITFDDLAFAEQNDQSSVLSSIIRRRNYRGFFKPKLETKKVRAILSEATSSAVEASLITKSQNIKQLADLTASGLRAAYATDAFRREISSYINHNLSRKRYGLHGYSLRMNLPTSYIIPKVMKRKDIGAKLARLNYESFISAPGVIVISSADDRLSWLKAGMVMQEIFVKLTALGISASIFAAAIETSQLRPQVQELMGPKSTLKPQLLFCVGNPQDELPYSVRKRLTEVLIL